MKTLFILGAGASKSFGYPSGDELKDQILAQLRPIPAGSRTTIFDLLVEAGNDPTQISEFANRLYYGLHDTIDDFLEAHQTNDALRRIGKQAIALNIAMREQNDALFRPSYVHWYKMLLDFLTQNPGLISSEHFSFLTFNYDRSLEHCLHHALVDRQENLTEIIEQDFLAPSNLCHVHGTVGLLPWQQHSRDSVTRDYGQPLTPAGLTQMAYDILSPHESFHLHAVHQEMLMSADVIVIIGFGFHRQNLARIRFEELSHRSDKTIFATVFQPKDNSIQDFLGASITVRTFPLDANAFVRDFLANLKTESLQRWGLNPSILYPTILKNLGKLTDGLRRP